MAVRAVSCLSTQSLTAMEVTTTVGSLIVLAQWIPKLLESPLAMPLVRAPDRWGQYGRMGYRGRGEPEDEDEPCGQPVPSSAPPTSANASTTQASASRKLLWYSMWNLMERITYTCRSRRVNTCIHTHFLSN